MNIQNIKELAEILALYGLTSIEICEADLKIKLEKSGNARSDTVSSINIPCKEASAICDKSDEAINFNNIKEIKSPVVGVFYSAPTPEDMPFVTIGSKVKKGDVLCIIEAMKLMNEVIAESDGEVVDICVKNGDIAEFGQVLFKMY